MLDFLLPEVPGLTLEKLEVAPQFVLFKLSSTLAPLPCPFCGTLSSKVHSYYLRQITDLPIGTFSLKIKLRVRRFYCISAQCTHTTFAERLGTAIRAYARRTQRCATKLQDIGFSTSGESGSRLSRKLKMGVSPDTILRLMRAKELLPTPTPRVLSVDDFAFRKGVKYGSILVDLEKGKVIDLLEDRTSQTFEKWLREHPGVEIISRDRAGAYADAARKALPNAVQVADRFHLAKNLKDTLDRLLRRVYPQIEPWLKPQSAGSLLPEASQELPLKWHEAEKAQNQKRRMLLYDQVQVLAEKGYNKTKIAQELGLSTRRVRMYLQAPPTPPNYTKRPTKLDPYKVYLKRRFYADNYDVARGLFREIQAQGYAGNSSAVGQYIIQLRQQRGDIELTRNRPVTQPIPLKEGQASPYQLAWWFKLPSERLTTKQAIQLDLLCKNLPELARAYNLSQEFVALLHSGTEECLDEWLERAKQGGPEEFKSFANGISRDLEAVKAGLSLKWNQGKTEGAVNRLKLVKRMLYGRGSFELLRRRVLEAA